MKNFTSLGRIGAVLLLSGLLIFPAPGGRAQGAEGGTVTSMDVRYVGPETISKDQILANMKTKVGTPIRRPRSKTTSVRFMRPARSRTFAFLANLPGTAFASR